MKRLKKPAFTGKAAVLTSAALSLNVALALGIGDIDVKSSLNQPLEASLPVFAIGRSVPADSLRIKLASPQAHAAAGLPYPRDLANTQFRVVQTAGGQIRVVLNTLQPVREPLVKFLLEISWADGRMMREVTMLLDPPGYQELPVARPTAVAQTRYGTATGPATDEGLPVFVDTPHDVSRSGLIARTEPRITERPAAYKPPQPKPRRIVIKDDQYGPVQAGDTLGKIASAAYGGDTDAVMANAQLLFKLNPDAFENGDINLLKKGAILRVPPRAELETQSAQIQSAGAKAKGTATPGIASLPVPAETADAGSRLKIEPADRKSIEIARKAAQAEAERAEAVKPASEPSVAKGDAPVVTPQKLPTPAPAKPLDPAPVVAAGAVGAAGAAATAAADIEQLRQTDETILQTLAKTQQDLAATRAEIERLIASIKSMPNAQNIAAAQPPVDSLTATILRWLPWALLLPLVPALVYFAARSRRREDPALASISSSPAPAPAPQQPRSTDIYAAGAAAAAGAASFTAEANKPAPLADTHINVTELPAATTQSQLIMPLVAETAAQRAAQRQEDEEFAQLFGDQDITLSAADTQEMIRPATGTGAPDAEATQIIQHDELPDDAGDSSLDIAQEAEIYLAYQQYSLAEKTIRKLLEEDPDNDRFKLLQLKLFAETGRIDELQKLSVDLLQRYPDTTNGTHQQIQNICERAFTKHTANLTGEFSAKPPVPVMIDLPDATPREPGIDFDDLTAETLYSEDISDYLSDNTLSDLDAFGTSAMTQPAIDALNPEQAAAQQPRADVLDDLPELSDDMDFLDDAVDTLVASQETAVPGAPLVENFSDEDYSLAQNRLHTVESLEIPFDLEEEIQKHDREIDQHDRRG